jgi:hypothetical protein
MEANMRALFYLFTVVFIIFSLSVSAQVAPLPDDVDLNGIFVEVVKLFGSWKGLTYQYQIAAILFILVGFFKNSSMKFLWDKLGKAKALMAPTLSLIAFMFLIRPFTFDAFIAAITTGVGASYMSQIFDVIKELPKVGPKLRSMIEFLGIFVKRK